MNEVNKADYRNEFYSAMGRESGVRSDYLMHSGFKYIKRKMVNGRWRYWYDDTANTLSSLQKKQRFLEQRIDSGFKNDLASRKAADMTDAISRRPRDYAVGPEEESVSWHYDNPARQKYHKETYLEDTREGRRLSWALDNAKYRVDKRQSSIGGKLDALMQAKGSDIANALNAVANTKHSIEVEGRKVARRAKRYIAVKRGKRRKKR